MANTFDIKSVILYITVFLLSILCTLAAENLLKSKRKNVCCLLLKTEHFDVVKKSRFTIEFCLAILFIGAAILIPSVFAALRDKTVGNDISIYVEPFERYMKNFPSSSYSSFYEISIEHAELFFGMLEYICFKYFNIKVLFFLIEFLTLLPIYIALYYVRHKISMTYSMLIYYLFFFNFSLSGMRVSIATSFIILSLVFFLSKKYKTSVFIAIIALLFHKSAIIIYPVIVILYRLICSKNRKKYITLTFIILMVVFFVYREIALVVSDVVSFVSARYRFYIIKYLNDGFAWQDIQSTELLTKSLMVLLPFPLFMAFKNKEDFGILLMLLSAVGLYFTLFVVNFYESTRIAMYFHHFIILYNSYVLKKYNFKNGYSKIIAYTANIMPGILYWGYFIMYVGAYKTNVYIFS